MPLVTAKPVPVPAVWIFVTVNFVSEPVAALKAPPVVMSERTPLLRRLRLVTVKLALFAVALPRATSIKDWPSKLMALSV